MSTITIGRGHIINSVLRTSRKLRRALSYYNGHHGDNTIDHIERNILAVWPTAPDDCTAEQYGLVMSVANQSYHDGIASQKFDTWAYDGQRDWLVGIRNTDISIEMDGDIIRVKTRNTDGEKIETFVKTGEVLNA